jgi:aspartate kinase
VKSARPVVLKFGGAALSHPEPVIDRVRSARTGGRPVVVVASAREGVTDSLRAILDHRRNRREHRVLLDRIEAQHADIAGSARRHLTRLRQLVRDVERSRRGDRAAADRILSQGERLAVAGLSQALERSGISARPVEADHLGLVTDNEYGASCILVDRSRRAVATGLGRILRSDRVPVVTGFFGRSLEGRVATLGRGGSDYSATSLGAILGSPWVELVKREVSILTADPAWVPAARPIHRLSYEEAEELAQFGARVLHPLTVEPARAAGVEIRVASLDSRDSVTTIGPSTSQGGTRALTLLVPLGLVRIRVPGGRQRPGVVAEVSKLLADARVNIVALFTSSSLLCVVLESAKATAGRAALEVLARRDAAVVEGPSRVGLVTAIGDGVLHDVARLPAEYLGQGEGLSATPRSVSLAVPAARSRDALQALHRVLVEEAPA